MRKVCILCFLSLLLVACASAGTTPVPTSTSAATDEPAALQHLVILYTNDEHGWLEATEEHGGAAGMLGLWREQEGYSEDGPFLILSGGDTWTGPAISSWFDGEPMVETMNAMGYHAAAIGNHEFDFGLDTLRQRAAEAEFPFLAANIREKEGSAIPDFALPYVVQEVAGVRVGLIGLASLATPQTTMPDNIADFDFIDYELALREIVPQAKADGAELLVVIGHICSYEMRELAPAAAELGVSVMGGGHCHQAFSSVVNNVALIQSGSFLENYVRVDIDFDPATGTVVDIEAMVRSNSGGTPDADVAAIVSAWGVQADEALSEVIGYVEEPIGRSSDAMHNLVTDAWLMAYPNADVALTNRGGFRQDIPAGEITLGAIVGVLPFDNVMVDVEVTGEQLLDNIHCCHPVAAGMRVTVGGYVLMDGAEIERDATYHVLINDFMYAGGDDYSFGRQDPDAYNTSIDWRQPVIEWIASLKTTSENPLDSYLDTQARQY